MSSRPPDTAPASWAAYHAALDHMGGPGRLTAAVELSEALREIRLAGIRALHPELTRRESVARLVWEEFGVALPPST
jgi:hypothetical protein